MDPHYKPNYTLFRGVEISALVLALVFLGLRLVKKTVRKTLSLDDGIVVAAAVLAVIITGIILRFYHFGYGKLAEDIDAANVVPIGKLSMAAFTTFPLCNSLIRISILITYLRIFPLETNKWVCYGLISTQAVYAIWAGLMVLLQCKPIAGYWNAALNPVCRDPRNQDISILAINSFFDIIVYSWPAHYLYKLRLPLKTRIGLILLFSLGIVNVALSFARLSLLLVMYKSKEYTRYGIWGCMCIVLEAHVGIMFACLPHLRFIWDFIAAKTFGKIIPSITISRPSPSRAQTKSPILDEDSHPFEELEKDERTGRVQKKQGAIVSTFFHADGSGEEILTNEQRC